MKNILLVGAGGFIGAILRYKTSGIFLHRFANSPFPFGTCAVNVAGCLLIGLIAGLSERHHFFSEQNRLLIITGLLGGFTTFSAFGYETVFLLRRGFNAVATSYVLISLLGGLIAVWCGLKIIDLLPSVSQQ